MSTILLEEADSPISSQISLNPRSWTAILLFGLVPLFLIKEYLAERELA